jgi:aspartyl-tRNA(Asn)/glutamyl-tRNA(Gln) amidotransferase subunit C
MKLQPEEVRKVARLARLSVSAEEQDIYAAQLSKILDSFQELATLDTSHSTPYSNDTYLMLREDTPLPSLPREEALANAPAPEQGAFLVPTTVEK